MLPESSFTSIVKSRPRPIRRATARRQASAGTFIAACLARCSIASCAISSYAINFAIAIPPANAQDAAGGGGAGSLIRGLMPIILIFAVMYLLLIRPQQKRQRQHRELVAQLKRGDKVLTSGGLYATVVRPIDDRDVEVELAGKLRVRMVRTSVIEVVGSVAPTTAKRTRAKK